MDFFLRQSDCTVGGGAGGEEKEAFLCFSPNRNTCLLVEGFSVFSPNWNTWGTNQCEKGPFYVFPKLKHVRLVFPCFSPSSNTWNRPNTERETIENLTFGVYLQLLQLLICWLFRNHKYFTSSPPDERNCALVLNVNFVLE